ncbi:MAG: hypothetical protein L0Z70_16100, partial [Chloroflexi bacterium]|nr:hypothetical protein [Chloroflexota bacterium]
IVPERHLEAWRLSRENLARGGKDAMNGVRQDANLQQTLRLIQNIPLARFQQNGGKDHKDVVQDMLIGYREQLIETIELLRKSRKPIPSSLPAAIKHIEIVLGIKHWVGAAGPSSGPGAVGGGSPPPATRSRSARPKTGSTTGVPSTPAISPEEEDLYRDLLSKARGDVEQVERLIAYEQKRAPHANRLEWIRRAIQRWLNDNQ